MAIPGLKPTLEVRAKVRIGEKGSVVKNGKTIEFPKSADHFLCDDPGFPAGRVTSLTVYLPFADAADNFSTGLEWWEGKLLVCYAKGDEINGTPVALRRDVFKKGGTTYDLLKGETILDPNPVGNERHKIACPVRECKYMKDKKCKPMGRLQFYIDGLPKNQGVFQIDTKSWNSIEKIEGLLMSLGDARGIPFKLSVSMEQMGTKKFPVLTLEEIVEVNSPADAKLADLAIQGHKALNSGNLPDIRKALAALLDKQTPGWRDKPAIVDRITEVTPKVALEKMIKATGL
jgi:hypothetical protein